MKICEIFVQRMNADQVYDGYSPSKLDDKLGAMPVRVRKLSLAEKLGLAWSEVEFHYHERPFNVICMVVTIILMVAALIYGASYIAPITDPGR